jgi:hypothetical protein
MEVTIISEYPLLDGRYEYFVSLPDGTTMVLDYPSPVGMDQLQETVTAIVSNPPPVPPGGDM